jgi:hypothetical protein
VSCSTWLSGMTCSSNDSCALLAFFRSTGGCSWTDRSGWFISDDLCEWYGLTCASISGSNEVTQINLPGNNLAGAIPADIADLFYLARMDYTNNLLTGVIPTDIERLSSLDVLLLHNNQYTDAEITSDMCYDSSADTGIATITADCLYPFYVTCPADCCICTNSAPSDTPSTLPSASPSAQPQTPTALPSELPTTVFLPSTSPTELTGFPVCVCTIFFNKASFFLTYER